METIESIAIENAGFEVPTLADGGFTFGSVPGWEIYDPNNLVPDSPTNETSNISVFNPDVSYYPGEAPEGENVGDVYLIQDPFSGFAGLSQTVDAVLSPNTQYTLQVDVGNAAGVFEGLDLTGFPGYRVELLAGGEVLAADNNTLSIAEGTFGTLTVTYNSTADASLLGEPLEIRLINPLQGPGLEVSFDNVRLTATTILDTSPRTLFGSSAPETLNGGDGNDTLYGNGGTDTLIAGAGDDLIYGGSQADTILGGSGNDTVYANGGSDLIDTGAGFDTVWLGGAATVILESGEGFDTIKNFQLGSTQLKVSSTSNLSFADSADGVQVFQNNDLLAVVSWQEANTFSSNTDSIFTL
jgi:Ca2+-binding RTX toxin-like protein